MVHFTVKPCGFLYACPTISERMSDNVGHYVIRNESKITSLFFSFLKVSHGNSIGLKIYRILPALSP